MNENGNQEYTIEYAMGDYPGFQSYEEARAFQRLHKLTGSSIVPSGYDN